MTAVPTPMPARPLNARPGEPPWNRLGEPTLGVGSTPVVSAILAVASLGLLPAIVWPLRWATLLERERGFYRELTGWWRRRAEPAAAARLDPVLAELRPRPMMIVLPWLAVLFVVLTAVLTVPANHFDWRRPLWAATLGYDGRTAHLPWASERLYIERLHTVWTWALVFAYGCQWYAVRSHGRAVGDLVRWTNREAEQGGFARVRNEAARLGLGPLWIAVGLAFCFVHAWWAVPMVLAGAAQRRYAEVGTPRLQLALGQQANDAFAMAAANGDATRYCPAPGCGARLPTIARFCGRCGAPAAAGQPAGA